MSDHGSGRTFLVDVDGTLCAQPARVCACVHDADGRSVGPGDVVGWTDRLPTVGLGRRVGRVFRGALDAAVRRVLATLSPVDGASAALTRLREAGHTVRIVTHRAPSVHALTRAWLADNAIPYDDFVSEVPRNKADLAGHVLVDDYHGHVADALAAGKRGVLLNRSYSDPGACVGADVARSWAEVLDVVGVDPG